MVGFKINPVYICDQVTNKYNKIRGATGKMEEIY